MAEHPIERVLSAAREALERDVAFVTKIIRDGIELRAMEGDTGSFGFAGCTSMPLAESYYKRVIDDRLPNAVADAEAEERTSGLDVTREAGTGAYAGFSLRLSDGSVYGTLCCLSHGSGEWLRDRDLRLMGELARGLTVRREREAFL